MLLPQGGCHGDAVLRFPLVLHEFFLKKEKAREREREREKGESKERERKREREREENAQGTKRGAMVLTHKLVFSPSNHFLLTNLESSLYLWRKQLIKSLDSHMPVTSRIFPAIWNLPRQTPQVFITWHTIS